MIDVSVGSKAGIARAAFGEQIMDHFDAYIMQRAAMGRPVERLVITLEQMDALHAIDAIEWRDVPDDPGCNDHMHLQQAFYRGLALMPSQNLRSIDTPLGSGKGDPK